jgi:oxygen-dependent protoporphyrinogen oxidase
MRPRAEESAADYATRLGGKAASQWLLSPALQGIYATPADRLSAQAIFGKRTRGRMRLGTPPGGMGEFTDRLHKRLVDRGVTFHFGQSLDALEPDVATLVCTNAPVAARLLQPHAPELSRAIGAVRMTEVVTTTAFFDTDPKDLRGFGVLFPRGAGVSALGVLFNAEIFEGRSALRLETWIHGGVEGSGQVPALADVNATIAHDRLVLTGREQRPIASYSTRRSPALPVYGSSILEVARCAESLPPWLGLAGNYLGQIGVSKLIATAEAAAARLARSTSGLR